MEWPLTKADWGSWSCTMRQQPDEAPNYGQSQWCNIPSTAAYALIGYANLCSLRATIYQGRAHCQLRPCGPMAWGQQHFRCPLCTLGELHLLWAVLAASVWTCFRPLARSCTPTTDSHANGPHPVIHGMLATVQRPCAPSLRFCPSRA